ncbi:flagellar protein FlaG [Gallaecimonas mangrovi]|uniref:flagellar protein FlaG n=1 Tax=Gallaecimonas mangrovi TaxID=2291597 RepID=UPI000E1FD7E5|nr:flagellar protein FlaG [Gallaecimonas mangrovi]
MSNMTQGLTAASTSLASSQVNATESSPKTLVQKLSQEPSVQAAAAKAGVKGQELSDAVQSLADYVSMRGYNLSFSEDEDSGSLVIKVIDSDTDKVIRQIPAEEVLKTAERLKELKNTTEQQTGIFLDKEV